MWELNILKNIKGVAFADKLLCRPIESTFPSKEGNGVQVSHY